MTFSVPFAHNFAPLYLDTRALIPGGYDGTTVRAQIDYFDTTVLGNSADFGDLTTGTLGMGSASSVVKALFAGGQTGSAVRVDIETVTIRTLGNASDVGDLTQARSRIQGGCGSAVYALWAGGANLANTVRYNIIDYVTIVTVGTATDFGDITESIYGVGQASSPTTGVYMGGMLTATNSTTTIQYVTIASAGNSTDWGSAAADAGDRAGSGNRTRAIYAGSHINSTSIAATSEYIDYATLAASNNFGNLSASRAVAGACSNTVRTCVCGGVTNIAGTTFSNVIDYFTFASPSAATDFGDLTASMGYFGGATGSHGGLQ